jgi:hypothetical protein
MKSDGFISVVKNAYKPDCKQITFFKHNLLTTDGRDWMHAQVYTNTSAGTRGAGYVALTTNTTGPAAGDTTLSGELASNGFSRADATTKTHTNDTNSTTIEHTFTASGTVNAIHKSAIFNASSNGDMPHIANFGTDASLISGDTLKVTWTLNLG